MSLVLDASASIAWCFADERTPAIDDLMRRIAEDEAYVPSIWRLEVANSLRSGMRRGRLTEEQCTVRLNDLKLLPIITDPETDRYAWSTTRSLSQHYTLSVYDACYLELAQRLNLPLATLDAALAAAAKAANIKLVKL
jgi:predicted nucleic acid-binding protein